SGDPAQAERSPSRLSRLDLRQSQPRGAALGAAERVAGDCDPLREDAPILHGRPLPRRRSRLDQALTGPSCLVAERSWDQVRWAIEAYAWRFDRCAKPS